MFEANFRIILLFVDDNFSDLRILGHDETYVSMKFNLRCLYFGQIIIQM